MERRVSIRPFPYPARAALSICNDIDNSTFEGFLQIHEFLNTGRATPLGDGLELEIGDSFWMYSVHPSFDDAFTYFDGTSTRPTEHAETMRALMQAGYLDVLHTWGNFSEKGGFTRALAEAACEELERHGIHPTVWVNHDDAVYNAQRLGGPGMGHRPGNIAYHADLTFALGVRFVWENLLTTIVGQERPLGARELVCPSVVKDLLLRPARYWARRAVSRAWLGNRLISRAPTFPAIDPKVRSFTRYGRWTRATADDLPLLLAPEMLDRLEEVGGASLVYVHLGQRRSASGQPLSKDAVRALVGLAERAHSGRLFVSTTSRLLRYVQVRNALQWSSSTEGAQWRITIHAVRDRTGDLWPVSAETLMGITFYTPEPERTEIIGPEGTLPTVINPPDHTGVGSVSIPWRPLRYPL